MFKKMVMVLVLLALALGLSGFALAQTEFKELKLTSVREEQYTGLHSKSGGIWDWFSRFEPAVYNIGGEWYLGLVYEFRE